ncbi:hypothetical protein Rhe02_54520 [Rhizocola hellebori]|uniref:Uncharacterized protein n=1 Tax=Rhizocola hellebori TaxID=1392758 RepID=A0A8J3QCZ2_9ACTN|nr:hypothetical protein [Rhizocola hellebori]GIH07385.1 hypothetical protein Rhe02_54520 [Rhizocola hellebori]
MNLAETSDLLALIARYDNRRIDDATVVAWQAVLQDLELPDCQAAVVRHTAGSDAYLKPFHIRQLVKLIRDENRKGQAEPLALPSRFEADEIRDQRIANGVTVLADHWKAPDGPPTDDLHGQALVRARRERGKRPVPGQRGSRVGGKQIKMPKLVPPPWANPDVAEQQAIQLLHESGKACGRRSCLRCQS